MPRPRHKLPLPVAAFSVVLGFLTFFVLLLKGGARDRTALEFIASSDSWLDKQACDWLSLCGLSHLNRDSWTRGLLDEKRIQTVASYDQQVLNDLWHEPQSNPDKWSEEDRINRTVPQYVLDHAPYVHLFSGEEFWPSDIAEHLLHTKPHINYTDAPPEYQHLNLSDLNRLNRWGRGTFLKSIDNVEERPKWLGSKYNIPERPESPDYEKHEHFPGITDPRDVPFSASDPDRYKWEDVGRGDIWFRKGRYPSYPPGRGAPWPEGPAANWSRHWHDLPE
ncbi:hypothetical protein LTS18_008867, partial [Coniosporium uncinatum]